MTEEVGKKVCEGTVADLMKDKTGKQTVVTLTRKNAYRVKKIREQGTDDEAVLFHFRKRCTGMGSYVHTIETADGETELHPSEFEKWEAVEFLYPGYLEDLLDAAYNAYLILKNGKLWNFCIPAIWKTCLMLHTTRTDGVPSNLKQGRKQTSCKGGNRHHAI